MKLIVNSRAAAVAAPEEDPLASFDAETPDVPVVPARTKETRLPRRLWLALGCAMAVVLIPVGLATWWKVRASAGPLPITLTVETTPAGAEVLVGGVSRGRAPLTLQVAAASERIEVVHGTDRIPVRLAAAPGSAVSQHIVFSAAAATASLVVNTEPANMKVSVDDVPRGVAPARVSGLTAGSHRVRLTSAEGATDHVVELKAGETLSLVLSGARPAAPAAPASAGGWLTIASAIPLQILEGGQVVGSAAAARTMMPIGSHDVELVNEELGFRVRRRVQVAAGAVTSVKVDLPKAPLSINAVPWADVSVGANQVGETPVGNYMVTIGRHDVVFRHPEFGERRQTVMVGLKTPARVTMDFKTK